MSLGESMNLLKLYIAVCMFVQNFWSRSRSFFKSPKGSKKRGQGELRSTDQN